MKGELELWYPVASGQLAAPLGWQVQLFATSRHIILINDYLELRNTTMKL